MRVSSARRVAAAGLIGVVGMMACRPSSPLLHLQTAAAQTKRATLHLVAIGIEDYGRAVLRQGGASDDAKRLGPALAALATPYYALRAHTLVGAAATRAAVMAALDSVQRSAGPDDLVALYYRGLGGPRFLVLADTAPMPAAPRTPGEQPPPAFEARLLRSNVLAEWLVSLHARQVLLVLEAPEASSYFHAIRERLAAPPEARQATKDLAAFATPGLPLTATSDAGEGGVLTAAFVAALGEEREARGLSLFSTLLPRVLARLDAPIVVHEAGADLVLGADSAAAGAAAALRDGLSWEACALDCPSLLVDGIENGYTLVGRALRLEPSAKLFVNGRRARRDGPRFEVELPPAALRAELTLRVLRADHTRFEQRSRLP